MQITQGFTIIFYNVRRMTSPSYSVISVRYENIKNF